GGLARAAPPLGVGRDPRGRARARLLHPRDRPRPGGVLGDHAPLDAPGGLRHRPADGRPRPQPPALHRSDRGDPPWHLLIVRRAPAPRSSSSSCSAPAPPPGPPARWICATSASAPPPSEPTPTRRPSSSSGPPPVPASPATASASP